jgi:Domain of unknown function (DUF4214)
VSFPDSPSRGLVAASFLVLAILAGRADALAGQLSLSWMDHSGGQLGFSIERAPSAAGPFAEIGRTAPNVTAYADTTVAAGNTYCYRVRATPADVVSYSNVACASPGSGGSATPAFITDFYSNVLGRIPAATELAPWTGFLSSNCNQGGFQAVGNSFFDSQEFRTSRPLTLTNMVAALYGSFLGRNPDPAGLVAWTGALRQQRIDVTMHFVHSAEFQSLVPDRRNPALVTPVVTRFYTTMLGREPDPTGLQSWVNYIVTTLDLEGAAVGFLTSAEFESRPLTSRSLVEVLYVAFLGREPDPSGWNGWDNLLRADLLGVIDAAFIPSGEFQARAARVCGG